MALSDAHHYPSLDEPNMGTPFSLCVALIGESGCEGRASAQNGSRVDEATRESRPPLASQSFNQIDW